MFLNFSLLYLNPSFGYKYKNHHKKNKTNLTGAPRLRSGTDLLG